MARRVFFSFHYERDIWRANVVRNHWLTKGDDAGFWDASLWEEAKKKGDTAIKKMIDEALKGTSVTAVLIGSETADRRWVIYEIEKSHEKGNGLLGVYIHNIKDRLGFTDQKGKNPFDQLYTERDGKRVLLSEIYPVYDWVYDEGFENFADWVEDAARQAGR